MKRKLLILFLILNFSFSPAFAGSIFDDENTMVVEETGLIYDTSESTYSESIGWEKSGPGFSDRDKRIASAAGAQAGWDNVTPGDNGYYEVYIWKNVVEDGDKNVLVSWFATGSSSGTGIMDCSQGESGWQYLGVCNTSDLKFKINVTASGEGNAAVSCFRLVKTTKEEFLNYLAQQREQALILKIGSENALFNGNKIKMTMGKAVIKNAVTMLPLRFVMEVMGAQVNWEENEKRIDITCSGNNLTFYVNRKEYVVNGERKTLDTEPYIEENRTMIPVRVFSEAVGKKVYWDERGIVVISEAELSSYEDAVQKGLEL